MFCGPFLLFLFLFYFISFHFETIPNFSFSFFSFFIIYLILLYFVFFYFISFILILLYFNLVFLFHFILLILFVVVFRQDNSIIHLLSSFEFGHMHNQEMEVLACVSPFFHFCQLFIDRIYLLWNIHFFLIYNS